jgi:hypothetical protein
MIKNALTLLFSMLVAAFSVQAQVTHEHTYANAAEIADVESFGYKYYVTDYLLNTVAVYNEDHTAWKNISLQVPANQFLYDVAYVSSRVFNSDDLVELIMVYYQYVGLTDTSGYYVYTTRVVNENGLLLADVPGGAYSFTITTGSKKNKLVVYVYDYSVSTYISSTEVYGLPDKVSGIQNPGQAEQQPFPNPTSGEIFLPLGLQQAQQQANIVVTDVSGKEFSRTPVKQGMGTFQYSTTGLPSGTYFYRIESNGKSIPAGKFIKK